MASQNISQYVFTYSAETELYYYQSLNSEGTALGYYTVYENLVDFQGTTERFIPLGEFDDRFCGATPPWRAS